MDKTVLGVFAVMKVIKLALSYAAITIATNYTSQIYTEKVYVRQENPPKLVNMLFLFLGIELLISVITLTCIGLLISFIMGKDGQSGGQLSGQIGGSIKMEDVAMQFAQDYVLYLISMAVQGSIVAQIMYSKKYFLYKDDGLRAIRAFSEILTQMSMFNGLIPFNMFVSGILNVVSAINK